MTAKPFSRRHFLGGMGGVFALACLPSRLLAENSDDILLRAVVMSDVHFSDNPASAEVERLNRVLDLMYSWSEKQSYPNFDALVVAGDMTNHGSQEEMTLFKQTMDGKIRPGTQKLLCMGNHEFYHDSASPEATHEGWKEMFGVEDNAHYIVNGFHFIALSPEKGTCRDGDYLYKIDWLREQLEQAKADDPQKPIFLFHHYHLTETVYGSLNGDCWGINDLRELLDQYPTVIDFSGHSHYPINDPRSVWQGNFTAFGTGTLSYFEMEGGHYNKFPPGYNIAAQCYVVEVHRDNSVAVRPFDIISKDFFDVAYLVAEPGNIDRYLYTDKRYDLAPRPYWKPGTEVRTENPSCFGVTLTFRQGCDKTIVHSYRVDLTDETGPEAETLPPIYAWSEYYFQPIPDPMRITLDTLEPSRRYRAEITAINPFGKESSAKISAQIETAKDEEDHTDRETIKPAANILSIEFEDGTVVNRAHGLESFAGRAVETLGRPVFVRDDELGGFVGRFNGQGDYLRFRYNKDDLRRMRRRFTMAVRFRFDAWGDHNRSVFSGTEGGASSIELNAEKKRLEFWLSINGKYTILDTPCEPGLWHTCFGVYDGKDVVLYLDGKEAARQACAGNLTYPAKEESMAYCVAAEVNAKGDGESFMGGAIGFARLYNWALTPEQVAALSAE
ncbi:MAG: metallophosphoesterase [Thermoguttaceae bacterium]|nr:metallophosphoesterase [Thermoguttaceae bacterium]